MYPPHIRRIILIIRLISKTFLTATIKYFGISDAAVIVSVKVILLFLQEDRDDHGGIDYPVYPMEISRYIYLTNNFHTDIRSRI